MKEDEGRPGQIEQVIVGADKYRLPLASMTYDREDNLQFWVLVISSINTCQNEESDIIPERPGQDNNNIGNGLQMHRLKEPEFYFVSNESDVR